MLKNMVCPYDIRPNTQQVFANLAAVCAYFNSVVKLNYHIVDIASAQVASEIGDQYVNTENPPTSTAVEVSLLFREEFLIEVEAVDVVLA